MSDKLIRDKCMVYCVGVCFKIYLVLKLKKKRKKLYLNDLNYKIWYYKFFNICSVCLSLWVGYCLEII